MVNQNQNTHDYDTSRKELIDALLKVFTVTPVGKSDRYEGVIIERSVQR